MSAVVVQNLGTSRYVGSHFGSPVRLPIGVKQSRQWLTDNQQMTGLPQAQLEGSEPEHRDFAVAASLLERRQPPQQFFNLGGADFLTARVGNARGVCIHDAAMCGLAVLGWAGLGDGAGPLVCGRVPSRLL